MTHSSQSNSSSNYIDASSSSASSSSSSTSATGPTGRAQDITFTAPLTGKVVAITGGSSGIGAATARHLARLGASVLIGARRVDRLHALQEELTAAGGRVHAVPLDVCDRASVNAFIQAGVETFGHVDVLINNAGVMPLARLSALQVDEWERTLDVNVRGVLWGIAAVLPLMKARGQGHIINLASIGAHRSYPGCAVYCASKFAVWAISDALRQEELDGDIRVTTISPGTTTSELADHLTDPAAVEAMRAFRAITIAPEAIAQAIGFAIGQPQEVDVSEIIVRPTRSPE